MVKHECKVTSFPGLFPFAINCSLQILRHESSEPGVTCISVKLKLTYRVLFCCRIPQRGSRASRKSSEKRRGIVRLLEGIRSVDVKISGVMEIPSLVKKKVFV